MHHDDGPYLPARLALLSAARHNVTNLTQRPSNFAQSAGNRVPKGMATTPREFVSLPGFRPQSLFVRNVEVDLDREVHSHLEMLIEETIRAGMQPGDAQRAARIELGGIELVKDKVREERIGNWLHSVISDCRYGVRQLRTNPCFTVVAVLTLALSIDANTAIYNWSSGYRLHGLQLCAYWRHPMDSQCRFLIVSKTASQSVPHSTDMVFASVRT
jgi:hypothetical protein